MCCIGENAIFNKKNANKCFRRSVEIHTKFTDTIKFRLKIKDYKNAGKKINPVVYDSLSARLILVK